MLSGATKELQRLRVRRLHGKSSVRSFFGQCGYISGTLWGVGRMSRRNPDLDDFFENGGIALQILGSDGKILRANRAELELLGYTAEEYIGRHIAEFHVDPSAIADILARLARGEKLNRYPAQLLAKDGCIRHVQITSSGRFRD